jgi:hypothetical protein
VAIPLKGQISSALAAEKVYSWQNTRTDDPVESADTPNSRNNKLLFNDITTRMVVIFFSSAF